MSCTTKIVHNSHDFHDKISVVHNFLARSTIFGAFFEVTKVKIIILKLIIEVKIIIFLKKSTKIDSK